MVLIIMLFKIVRQLYRNLIEISVHISFFDMAVIKVFFYIEVCQASRI